MMNRTTSVPVAVIIVLAIIDSLVMAGEPIVPSQWPILNGQQHMVSPYGPRRDCVYNAYGWHNGVDISAPAGEDVMAVYYGQVMDIGPNYSDDDYRVHLHHGGQYSDPPFVGSYVHLDPVSLEYLSMGQILFTGGYVGDLRPWDQANRSHLHYGGRSESGGVTYDAYHPMATLPYEDGTCPRLDGMPAEFTSFWGDQEYYDSLRFRVASSNAEWDINEVHIALRPVRGQTIRTRCSLS